MISEYFSDLCFAYIMFSYKMFTYWSLLGIVLILVIVYIYSSREAELLDKFFLPSTKVGSEDGEKPKKKRKERLKEGKAFGKDSNIVKEDKVQQDEVKANNMILGSL
jgi:hypothetical protein